MRVAVALLAVVLSMAGCGRAVDARLDLADFVPSDLGVDDLGTCAIGDGGSCALFPQCGCPSGQSCDVVDTHGATACRPAGSTPNWNACTTATCIAGSTCVVAGGVCAPLCASDSDCGGPYHPCEPGFPGVRVCTPLCDPVDPQSGAPPYTACGSGVGCQPLYGSDGASHCSSENDANGTQGAFCGACAIGFLCVGQQCRKACHVGSNSDCGVLVCIQMTNPADGSPVVVGTTPLGYRN